MMLFATLLQWKIADELPNGPMVIACGANWWRIMTLTADLFLTRDNSDALECMGHLWYIQVDFQCYLLLPFLVLIFSKNHKLGIAASLVPTLICVVIRFYFGFYYHFVANTIVAPFQPIHDGNQSNQAYFKPWTRMAVYFIGVSSMFLLIAIEEKYE